MGNSDSRSCSLWCSKANDEGPMEGERLDEFPRLVATRTREVGDRWSVSTSSSEFGKKRLGARGTIESSFVRTNSSPSLFRNAEEVGLRPKWFTARDARERRNPSRFPVSTFVEAQRKTLAALHDVAARAAWREAHAMHLRGTQIFNGTSL